MADHDEVIYIPIQNNTKVKVYVSYRPWLKELLTELKPDFELILYSGGTQPNTLKLVEGISKEENYFDFILSQPECSYYQQLDYYIRDLNVLV